VSVERAHKLARRHVPHLDGAVARRRDDVAPVEVDDVNGSSVADEHPTKADVGRRVHVPDGHRPVLNIQTRQRLNSAATGQNAVLQPVFGKGEF